MRISPIKANSNTSFGIKYIDAEQKANISQSPYQRDLSNLIAEKYGQFFSTNDIDKCLEFVQATQEFKEENSKLLKKHFSVVA